MIIKRSIRTDRTRYGTYRLIISVTPEHKEELRDLQHIIREYFRQKDQRQEDNE